MGIREGGNVKKCRPVVKEPSGGTLLFRCALPARGTSRFGQVAHPDAVLCLGAACTGCISARDDQAAEKQPLPRRCLHGVHPARWGISSRWFTLPRRCLHGVHLSPARRRVTAGALCLGAACTGCIAHLLPDAAGARLCLGAACTGCILIDFFRSSAPTALPRRCLHGVHPRIRFAVPFSNCFASALPARGASRLCKQFLTL